MSTYTLWNEFSRDALHLQTLCPDETRLSVKYDHRAGKLIIQATNDRTKLKYKTDQAQDLKKLDTLSRAFTSMAQTGKVYEPPAPVDITIPGSSSAPPAPPADTTNTTTTTGSEASPAPKQGASSQSKKNKKKGKGKK
ncbi:MAG: hypothetical protein DHS80DRAFT_32056 [Piptocephalis tieghemiana]|nr:MAG: hypothetical protein DHS80DRAFT_32056 [Piptocephalis tieghemiana]